jgi:hypothetical protein
LYQDSGQKVSAGGKALVAIDSSMQEAFLMDKLQLIEFNPYFSVSGGYGLLW